MSGPQRILITVSREFRDWNAGHRLLRHAYQTHPGAVLLHGACDPGDAQAAAYWRHLGGEDLPVPADWPTCAEWCKPGHRRRNRRGEYYCPTAGMRRNQEMVEQHPELVIALLTPGSRGAKATATMARRAGLNLVEFLSEARP